MKQLIKWLSLKRKEHLEERIEYMYNRTTNNQLSFEARLQARWKYNELAGTYLRRYDVQYMPLARKEELQRAVNNGYINRRAKW